MLAKAPIKPFNATHKAGWPTETSRAPGEVPSAPAPPYQQEWAYAMKATTYSDFSQRIWNAHDTLHVWVGGTMAQVDWAAFDPLFFAHHANVDGVLRFKELTLLTYA